MLGVGGALLWLMGQGFTFFYDEWDFVLRRRQWDVGSFVLPHNEHLSIIPVAIYKTLFGLVGLDYGAYRCVGLAFHLTVVALLFSLIRSRLGAWLGLMVAAPFVVFGSGWEDVLWPFQIGFLGSLGAGLAALLALDRRDRLGDVAASALLAVALGSSSLGVPVVVGVIAQLLWQQGRRRALWVPLVPAALYAGWWLRYSPAESDPRNALAIPGFVADSLAASAGGFFGLSVDWGRVVAVVILVAVGLFLLRTRSVTGRFVMLLTTALTFWTLTALARAQLAQPSDTTRYVYPGAVLVVLIVVEMAPAGWRPSRRAFGCVAAAAVFAAWANLNRVVDAADDLRARSAVLTAELGATEAAGGAISRDFQPDPVRAPQITSGLYRNAVAELGSPADTPAEVRGASQEVRASVDDMLVRGERLSLRPPTSKARGLRSPTVVQVVATRLGSARGCVRGIPDGPGSAVDIALPAGGLSLHAAAGGPVEVRMRRFSDEFPANAVSALAAGMRAELDAPNDRLRRPWIVRLSTAHRIVACRLR